MLFAGLLLTACGDKKEEAKQVPYVKTTTAIGMGDNAMLTFPGKTKSVEDVNVAFRVSGPIRKVYVKEGDYVKRGQMIAEMDPRDYRVQLSATQAEYEQIKADAERVIALYNEGNTTASNYDKARYGLQQITEKLANHRNQLADTKLYAPISGYIQKRLHSDGETVSAGMPVVSMFSSADTEIEIFVPASDYAKRDQLVSAFCSFEVVPDENFPLELSSYSKEANASQLYSVRFKIASSYDRSKITPGMTTMVYVRYNTDDSDKTVKVPTRAVYRKDGKAFVFVLDEKESVVHQRSVTVGRIDLNGNIEVKDGVKTGESVVTAGVRFLQDGQKVRMLPATSDANVGGLL